MSDASWPPPETARPRTSSSTSKDGLDPGLLVRRPHRPRRGDPRSTRLPLHAARLRCPQPASHSKCSTRDPTSTTSTRIPKVNGEFNSSRAGAGHAQHQNVHRTGSDGACSRCDVHNWMTRPRRRPAHPFFAVTNDGGAFEITGLPPGTYTDRGVARDDSARRRPKVTIGDQQAQAVCVRVRAVNRIPLT